MLGLALVVHDIDAHHRLQEVMQRRIALWNTLTDMRHGPEEEKGKLYSCLPGSSDTTKSGAKMLLSIWPKDSISPPRL
jgi:hypothetical protein